MTSVMVEISSRPQSHEESEGVVLRADLETLTEDAVLDCNDDNPYR